MKFADLDSWLRWQETLHPETIELGLERVSRVLGRLPVLDPGVPVITVAGTNGKGSCVAMIEALAIADRRRVGSYTSPHLFRYNERIRIDGEPVSDARLIAAFEAVERARGETPLTYFEFGTLAALEVFAGEGPDVVVLEVGLGGRLDAVNVVDPHVAVITSIGLDHTDWLGEDREAIGAEKAGILRDGIPLVLGEPDPPASVIERAREHAAPMDAFGREWRVEFTGDAWRLGWGRAMTGWLSRGLLSGVLFRNAGCGVLAYSRVRDERLPGDATLERALSRLALPGRMQRVAGSWIVDLAHNGQGAAALASKLEEERVNGRTLAVFGIFKDKDIPVVLETMLPLVDHWYVADLGSDRAEPADALRRRIEALGGDGVSCHPTIREACAAAREDAGQDDRIVAFGSFHAVAPTLEFLGVYSPASEVRGAPAAPR